MLNPKSQTLSLNPKAQTLNPKPQTLDPKPQTLKLLPRDPHHRLNVGTAVTASTEAPQKLQTTCYEFKVYG